MRIVEMYQYGPAWKRRFFEAFAVSTVLVLANIGKKKSGLRTLGITGMISTGIILFTPQA